MSTFQVLVIILLAAILLQLYAFEGRPGLTAAVDITRTITRRGQ